MNYRSQKAAEVHFNVSYAGSYVIHTYTDYKFLSVISPNELSFAEMV